MRIFVSEYVSSGAWPDGTPPQSLAREGRSMLAAILADFANRRLPRVTTWDRRLGDPPTFEFVPGRMEFISVEGPRDEASTFRSLAGECDAAFVIAPEFDGILADRTRTVGAQIETRLLGPTVAAVELCSDKLTLSHYLQQSGVPTIPTRPVDAAVTRQQAGDDWEFPYVMKPRDGAGSLGVSRIANRRELERTVAERTESKSPRRMIVQPHISGLPVSVGAIVSPDRERIDIFPAGLQRLTDDGTFQYLGGLIPSPEIDRGAVRQLVTRTVRSIAGLQGYVGFDLILPTDPRGELLVCEINPRLTTSYLGYRKLTNENLAERLLYDARRWNPIVWNNAEVSFTPDGGCTISS